jgi:hypothetical protein
MSEEEFLKSTPRKVGSLWERHIRFNGWKFKDEDDKDNVDDDRVYNVGDPEIAWFENL